GDGAAGVTAAADPGDERLVDLGNGQGRQGVPRRAEVTQERLDGGAVSVDGPRRQAPFTAEVVGESIDLLGVKARPGGRQLQTAEEAQPGGGVLEEGHPRGAALPEQGRLLGPEQGASLDFGQRDGFAGTVSQAEVVGDEEGVMGGSLQGPAS